MTIVNSLPGYQANGIWNDVDECSDGLCVMVRMKTSEKWGGGKGGVLL